MILGHETRACQIARQTAAALMKNDIDDLEHEIHEIILDSRHVSSH